MFILALFPGFVTAQTATDKTDKGLSPLQVAKIQQVRDIAISSSGAKVAYTVSKQADPRKENDPAKDHLFLLDLNSGNTVPFIKTMDVNDIAFRPGKQTITFLGKREGDETNALMEIPISGGNAQPIFSFDTSIEGYSWAPDGNHLAFMAPDTTEDPESLLPYEPEIYEENLKQIRGYVINLAKKNHSPHQIQVKGSLYQMHWSPNGKKLAIAVAPTPKVDDYYMAQQVMIVDRHGKKVFGKVDHRGKLGKIAWSPDGDRLAMLAAADINDPIAGRLLIVSAEGGKPTQLQPQYKGKFEQVAWADSTSLRYLTSEGLWSTYGSINADGTNMQPIIGRGGPSLEQFARAGVGSLVFIADSSVHPNELYKFQRKDSTLSRMTNNNKWLTEVSFGTQKAVSWKAQDGTKLQGILIYPVDYKGGQEYPLITTVHGGPESHYNNGWLTSYSNPGQVAAGDGFFVFYPNYRGSTGRGEAFAKSSQADMAGAEFDDIVAGIDELIKAGIADSTRIGVTGGSYGGYATGWMATRYTDRFAAGVMFVGISNNISKWGTSDIPEELFLVHARERIWDDYGSFLRRSPIYYAGQADTPLLIMAGKEDTRVDPSQSYELYRHIKTRTDTPVRLVLYPEEGHGNQNATARYDYNLRMMRWFNFYLKGGEEGSKLPDTELK
ncbi:MAG TPA: S9 family peptidase, partial [Fodinibius sp.]|nr:S9 family peptidase [Fodinibius sp.]